MAKAKVKAKVKVDEVAVVGEELELWVLVVVTVLDPVAGASAQSVTIVHPIGLVFRVLSNIAPNAVLG